jgi:hypothetical protein
MREFSGSHHSDALYQGTTLVQSCRVTKDLGFQPPGIQLSKARPGASSNQDLWV